MAFDISTIEIDEEFAALCPPLTDEEREQLLLSVTQEGFRDPIVAWTTEGKSWLIDGHNRLDIYRTVFESDGDVKPPSVVERFDFKDRDAIKEWIIRNQFARRNLTPMQRAELALKLEPLIAKKAKANQKAGGGSGSSGRQNSDNPVDTKKELAKAAGVSHDTISRAKKILEGAPPEVVQAVRSGDTSINQAYSDIRHHEKATERKKKRAEMGALAASPTPEQPHGTFGVIYADPPWKYEHSKTDNREIENQYPTMELEEIRRLKIPAADDCVLFLWATSPKLEESMSVVNSWGFSYRTCMVWDKEKIGMGYYARQQHELLLIATRGEPGTPEPSDRPPSILRSPRGRHSSKPEEFAAIIQKMYPNARRVELFARKKRDGWEVWGKES